MILRSTLLLLALLLTACGGGSTGDATGAVLDRDHDGIPDTSDTDDDNDGFADSVDAFPLDVSEHNDLDHDGIGDNADIELLWDTGDWNEKTWN